MEAQELLEEAFGDDSLAEDSIEEPVWVAPRQSLAQKMCMEIEFWVEAVWENIEESVWLTLWGIWWWLLFVKVLPPLWNSFEKLFQ